MKYVDARIGLHNRRMPSSGVSLCQSRCSVRIGGTADILRRDYCFASPNQVIAERVNLKALYKHLLSEGTV